MFEQYKLDKTINQTREIFDKYIYQTNDTVLDVLANDYFKDSRFIDVWSGAIVEASCSDGIIIGHVDGGTLAEDFNSKVPTRTDAKTITDSQPWAGSSFVYVDTQVADIVFTLPPASEYPGESIYIKRISGGINIAQLVASGTDTFDSETNFNDFTMAFKGEYVGIKSDGVGTWYITSRRTFCSAGISLAGSSSFAVTPTPTTLNVFNFSISSTRNRCESDLLDNTINILEIQRYTGDQYNIRFSGVFEYSNNTNLHLGLYCDGDPVPSLETSSQGNGPGDSCTLSLNQTLLLNTPAILELRIWGSASQIAPISSLIFEVNRIGG